MFTCYCFVVDPTRFQTTQFGQAAREPGNKWAFWYYKPGPIPRDLPLATRTVKALSDADASLGRLQGSVGSYGTQGCS
ncbi:hypothetical protein GCM10022275_16690 [Tessaracoccus defluvii]